MGTISRLGVIDSGETAVRVITAVHGAAIGGGEPIAAVLVLPDGRAAPWYGREADEVMAVDETRPEERIDEVVAALQRHRIDGVWLGDLDGLDRRALVEACELAGITVVGPTTAAVDAVRRAAAGDAPIDGPCRRIDVEVLADAHGTVWCLGSRDVTLRHGDSLMLSEAPATTLSSDVEDELCARATSLVAAAGYVGAAIVSFQHDGERSALVDVDAVAAPVHATTEERTGTSIIAARVEVACGRRLGEAPAFGSGVAVAARLQARDPADGLAVVDGEVAQLSFPVGTGVRIDANRRPGDPVGGDDPLLAVFTAWGPDRATSLQRLRRALERTSVVLHGGTTNRTLLLAALGHDDVVDGRVDDQWLSRALPELIDVPPSVPALLVAAVEAYEADDRLAQEAFLASAARGRPGSPDDVGDRIVLSYRGATYPLSVDRTGPDSYAIELDGTTAEVTVDRLDTYERRITCGGRRHRAVVSPTPSGVRVDLADETHLIDRDDGAVVRAGWPALVVSVLVEPGDQVTAGQPIAVLESMKMETTVNAPHAGEVTSVSIATNDQIERGAALLRVRPHAGGVDTGGDAGGERLSFDGFEQRVDFTRKPCDRVYDPLGHHVLGFDLSPVALQRLRVQQRRLGEIAEPADTDLLECEDGLLDIVADLGALYRPQTEFGPADEALAADHENTQEYLIAFAQWLDADHAGLPAEYRERLVRALGRYGVTSLERTPELEAALTRLFRSLDRIGELAPLVTSILQRRLDHRRDLIGVVGPEFAARLDRLASAMQGRQQPIADLARDVRFHFFDEPPIESAEATLLREMDEHIDALAADPDRDDREHRLNRLVWCPIPLRAQVVRHWRSAGDDPALADARRAIAAEVYLRRFYRIRDLSAIEHAQIGGVDLSWSEYAYTRVDADEPVDVHLVLAVQPLDRVPALIGSLAEHLESVDPGRAVVVDVIAWRDGEIAEISETAADVRRLIEAGDFGRRIHRLDVTVTSEGGDADEHLRTQSVTFRQDDTGDWVEDELLRNLHPMLAKRLELWRLSNFALERRPSPEDVYVFLGIAHENPADRRVFALAEIRDLEPATDPVTGEVRYPRLERTGLLALAAMRTEVARHSGRDRPVANRLVLDVTAPWTVPAEHLDALTDRFAPLARRAGLEKVVLKVRVPDPDVPGGLRPSVIHIEGVGSTLLVREDRAGVEPVKPLGPYRQKVLTAARFGVPYPFEIVRLLTERGDRDGRGDLPPDRFVELELEPGDAADGSDDRLVPTDRPAGNNTAHIVVGLITNHSEVHPEGMTRVALLSDPTQGLGNLAEPECRRIDAALAYALEHRLPVEWFAVSSGALIAMDSGTENMDWIALTLRRLIEFTQAGGEVNIVVTGINVGGQPYWNAEATMLTHTKGILVMTPSSTMVLTGKQALDFSGAVSAEDNSGIGGYDRVMGPNGQAQYWAPSFPAACELLLRHYDLTYVVPGERFPRRRPTADTPDRDVCPSPHVELEGSPFAIVGDVFSDELNPERKQPFDMRSVMRAVADTDSEPLERWRDLRDGETSIVWDTTVGGQPVCMLGLESHTVRRKGFVPADGPTSWTSGTLFPHSSRKTARAINAASGNRPLVVLANLSGFDGSPESMRRRQLEFGAEIGRAVTNFDGPIVFVVVSRYHGGAFVVFSKALNESMEIAAVEGAYASVIGGAPAAATVFAREVRKRTQSDERVRAAAAAAAEASGAEAAALRVELAAVTARVRSEQLGAVADEFDAVHTIERALEVGSVDRIIPAVEIRPYVIDALARGMAKFTSAG